MNETHTLREKGRAAFLAALMVLSVFAMSAAFAGGAAAVQDNSATADSVPVGQESVDQDVSFDIELSTDSVDSDTVTIDTSNALADAGATVTDVSAEAADGDNSHSVTSADTSDGDVEIQVKNDDGSTSGGSSETATITATLTLDTSDASATSGVTYNINADAGSEDSVDFDLSGSQEIPSNADRDLSSDATLYQGQEVGAYDLDATADQYEIRELDRSGSDARAGTLAQTFNAENNGTAVVDTSSLEGEYVIIEEGADRNDGGINFDDGGAGSTSDVADNSFEVAAQDIDAEWDADSVTQGQPVDLEVSSDIRSGYDVQVSSEDLNTDELATLFDIEDYDENEDYVEIESGSHTVNFSEDIQAGNYTLDIEVADSTAEDSASIEVTERDDTIQFSDSVYEQEAGDIAEIDVDLGDSNSGVVFVGQEDIGYLVAAEITGADDEETVTLEMNTNVAGTGNTGDLFEVANGDSDATVENTYMVEDLASQNENFNTDEYDASTDIGDPIEAGDYDLRLSTNTNITNDDSVSGEQDVATLALGERSTDEIASGVAPGDAEFENASDIADTNTARDEVAMDDNLVLGVDASGIHGLLAQNEDSEINALADGNDNLNLTIEQQNPGANRDPITVDLTNSSAEFYSDADNDTVYVVMNTDALSDKDEDGRTVEAGQEYTATFTVNEDYYGLDDNESVETNFELVETEGSFDNLNDEDVLEVEQNDEASVTGETNVAPGTELEVRHRASGDNAFLKTESVEVQSDGTFEGTFDFGDEDLEVNFTSRLIHDNDLSEVDATVVESTADPHPVTVTVENEDGDVVSDAEVEIDGETVTTNDDGEADFELQHGEYNVTVTANDTEGSGTLTVDDDTADSVTLTLGEEEQNLNEGDGDGGDGSDGGDGDGDGGDGSDGGDGGDGGDGSDDQPGFGIAVALIALLAAAGIATRRS